MTAVARSTDRKVLPILLVGLVGWVGLGAVTFAACSDSTLEDLPNKNQDIVQTEVTVYQMPDQFPNITFFCNGSTGVYLNTRQANSTVLNPNDPKCGGNG